MKIAATATSSTVVRRWQTDRSLTCLHLEHPRRYVATTTDLVANSAPLTERLTVGTSAMIQRDLGVLRSPDRPPPVTREHKYSPGPRQL